MKMKLSSNKKFLIGLFVVLAAYAVFSRLLDGVVLKLLSACIRGSGPIIGGLVIAYLLNPILRKMERLKLFGSMRKRKRGKGLVRCLCIVLLFILVLGLVGLGIAFIVPSVYDSIKDLIEHSPDYFQAAVKWLGDQPWLKNVNMIDLLTQSLDKLTQAVKENAQAYLMAAGRFLLGTGNFLLNGVMSFLVAFFLLKEKEKFSIWFKKLWRAVVGNDNIYRQSLDFIRDANKVFSAYIVGRLIESFILAVIAYVGFLCFGVRYALLFAFVVGATNLIPYFGPFIGGVPVVLLVIFDDPMKAVWITVFLVAIQQLDSFVLSPWILGDKLKASPLWILIGAILGGAMFGMAGMILGAPLVVIVVNTAEKFVRWRQEQREIQKIEKQS